MDVRHFVMVTCDVRCNWQQLAPTYRAYVNDELFVQRVWSWTGCRLEELFQILAPVGQYQISYRLIDPHEAALWTSNWRVIQGPAVINVHGDLRITG